MAFWAEATRKRWAAGSWRSRNSLPTSLHCYETAVWLFWFWMVHKGCYYGAIRSSYFICQSFWMADTWEGTIFHLYYYSQIQCMHAFSLFHRMIHIVLTIWQTNLFSERVLFMLKFWTYINVIAVAIAVAAAKSHFPSYWSHPAWWYMHSQIIMKWIHMWRSVNIITKKIASIVSTYIDMQSWDPSER